MRRSQRVSAAWCMKSSPITVAPGFLGSDETVTRTVMVVGVPLESLMVMLIGFVTALVVVSVVPSPYVVGTVRMLPLS